jgi:hypothetical protein
MFMLVALLLDGASSSTAQSEVTLVQRCGTEQAFSQSLGFWSRADTHTLFAAEIKRDRDMLTLKTNPTRTAATSTIYYPHSTAVLYDGAVLVLLFDPGSPDWNGGMRSTLNRELAVSTSDPRFTGVTIPAPPEGLNWWLLLPETEPGRFGIFGWKLLEGAFILPVTLNEQKGFAFGEPQMLPFDFHPTSSGRYTTSISPDWRYITSVQYLPELNEEEYFIYSINESRFIWRTPYDGDGIPDVLWLPQSNSLIAITTKTVKEQRGILTGVYVDGSQETLVDLNAMFNSTVDINYSVGVSPNHVAFALQSIDEPPKWVGEELLMFAADTRQIIDLCQTGSMFPILPSKDGRFILFQDFVNKRGEVRLLELATGNYSDFTSGLEYVFPIGNTLFELKGQD